MLLLSRYALQHAVFMISSAERPYRGAEKPTRRRVSADGLWQRFILELDKEQEEANERREKEADQRWAARPQAICKIAQPMDLSIVPEHNFCVLRGLRPVRPHNQT